MDLSIIAVLHEQPMQQRDIQRNSCWRSILVVAPVLRLFSGLAALFPAVGPSLAETADATSFAWSSPPHRPQLVHYPHYFSPSHHFYVFLFLYLVRGLWSGDRFVSLTAGSTCHGDTIPECVHPAISSDGKLFADTG